MREGIQGSSFELNHICIAMSKNLLDESLSIIWANDYFYQLLGLKREEKYNLKDLYDHLEDYEKMKASLMDAVKNNKQMLEYDTCLSINNGQSIWMRMTVTIIKTQEKVEISIVYTQIDDIMHEKETLYQLKEERKRNFEWLMSEYEGNVYLSDMDTYELLYLNKTAYETLKATKEQVIGRKCYEVIQGRTSPCPFCTNHILKEDESYNWEFYNPTLERTFMIKNRQINWEGHRTRIELSHDMYSAEYKLSKKDQEREAILKSIPGGLARLDTRDFSTILWYNEKFLELIGYTAEQFENELQSQCRYIQEDDLKRALVIAQTLTKTGDNAVFEVKMNRRDGEERILTVTLCYLSAEDSWDGIPSYYSVGLDVTEARREEERQRQALEDAYQIAKIANSAKTDFLSSMSHDIRTPMNAIVGMASIAQAHINFPEKVSDCLHKIKISSRHLLSLINEVLDMSKIESGKIDLMLEDVNLPELIDDVSDMCRALIDEKQQDFSIVIGRIKHEKVVADGDRLKQIFMNLISNAVKYTPRGGQISLVINELDSLILDKGRFEFKFYDNGIGMSEDFLPHIFEPFSRAEDTRINKIQGTGLGMAITENIVNMMNGTIEVESQLGKGTIFTVSIPLQLQLEEEENEEKLVGQSVLVVDDDQIVCESAVMLINELGMRGEWVLSGMEALERVTHAHNIDKGYFAVIIDWKMPDMDGLETVKAIREKLDENVPIIIVSAYDLSDIEEEFTRAGADAFITKPLFKSKILHVLSLFCTSEILNSKEDILREHYSDICGSRILLVEDNELNREIAEELLSMKGVLVESAANGEEALKIYNTSPEYYYTAILMDIQMPVMNGYEATKHIRQLKREDVKSIPIIALTANVFFDDIIQAQRAGMNDHIAKPIDIDNLTSILEKYI